MARPAALLACHVVAVAGCFSPLAIDPTKVNIRCDGDDCPQDLVCAVEIHRCVAPGGDRTPPGVVAFSVEPALANASVDEVVVTFTVDNDLGAAPEVFLRTATTSIPLTDAVANDTGGRHRDFSFSRALADAPAEPDGVADVVIALVDRNGNSASVVEPNAFVLDTRAPGVVFAVDAIAPPAGSLLRAGATATALADGSTLHVSVTFDEPLADAPAPSASLVCGGASFDLDADSGATATFSFVGTIAPTFAADDGPCAVHVRATDLAGNAADVDALDDVSLLRTPPTPPSTDAARAVVMTRYPHGAAATAGARVTHVAGGAGSAGGVSASSTDSVDVVVLDLGTNAEIARAAAGADGSFDVTIGRADISEVALVVVDGAGNASTPASVRDVDVVETLGGKVAGDVASNPHAFFSVRRLTGLLGTIGAAAGRVESGAETALPDGVRVDSSGGVFWRRAFVDHDPTSRHDAGMAYDTARDVVVLAGGEGTPGGNIIAKDQWQHDGRAWRRVAPSDPEGDGDPLGSDVSGPTLAYDAKRAVIVGVANTLVAGAPNTWEYDGASWRVRVNDGDTGAPNVAPQAAMAYDEARAVTVLLTDTGGGAPTTQTWEWDGDAWAVRCGDGAPTTCAPAPRSDASIAYDAARGRAVVFGGATITGTTDEHWEYDGASATWRQRCDGAVEVCAKPPPRRHAALAYDASRGVTVLYGGAPVGIADPLHDTWTWDGAAWTAVATACADEPLTDATGLAPNVDVPPQPSPQAAYDALRARVVLVISRNTGIEDTWTFAADPGACWQRLGPADNGDGAPPVVDIGAAAFDDVHNELVMFGSDTWLLDAKTSSWTHTGFTDPAPERFVSSVFDHARHRVVMFGAPGPQRSNDLWEWNVDALSWQVRCDATTLCAPEPAPRKAPALAYDEDRHLVVMFGGANNQGAPQNDTWEWDGSSWAERCTGSAGDGCGAQPVATLFPLMAFDPIGGGVVLLAEASSGDFATWRFTAGAAGTTWSEIVPESGTPQGLGVKIIATSASAGRIVLLQAPADANPFLVTTFDGTAWSDAAVFDGAGDGAPADIATSDAQLVDDGAGGAFFVSVDDPFSPTEEQTWRLDLGANDKPAQVMRVNVDAVGEPVAALTGADVRFDATATSSSAGVDALVFGARGWQVFATSASGASIAAPLPALSGGIVIDGAVNVAVAPHGVNGAGFADTSTDYAELALHYRL